MLDKKNKMQIVKVLYLKGCELCKKYKDILNDKMVVYIAMDADDNGDYADHVEDLLKINHYPITVIEEGKETTFIYNTDDGVRLGFRRLAANVVAIGCLDVDSMVQNVLSLIKK
jgi:hypothetical protein